MKLEELVERYCNNKSEMDSYKKQVDEDNKEMKKLFAELGSGNHECSSGGWTVKYSVVVSESFDDKSLLETLKKLGATNCIKTVEVVDMEMLENEIYNGRLNASELASCRVRKETPKITYSKTK